MEASEWARLLYDQYHKYLQHYRAAREMFKVNHYVVCLAALVAQFPELGE